ncbi:hypothetical protein PMAYCL1PPCAC_14890 [Pristionchus mayeri]|uniref:Nuclear receptor domain-containing protein n=1 Tax=Pristionchus mayeri TaxID=1317129 RepID=A0AAN5CHY3_9BILA|nr:hypothetical protein PMAYCL1PPCAC_14890 [Pristionchus mayeri]
MRHAHFNTSIFRFSHRFSHCFSPTKCRYSSVAMAESASSLTGKCLVCATPNDSVHFGIDACRACSSFFKRAVLSGHRFPCRRGDHKCPVQRGPQSSSGSMCRGCRYDRCAAIGMTYDGPMRINKRVLTEPKTEDPSTPSFSRSPESLLDRIAREHNACLERRRSRELQIVTDYNLARIPHPTEEVYHLSNFDCALASFNVTVSESWNFLLSLFPAFGDLTYDDQRQFFRLCYPQFTLIDGFYRTKRIFGGFEKYSMCTVLIASDIHDAEVWLRPNDGGLMRKELIEVIRVYMDDQMAMMVPAFQQADICEEEKHALLALLLTESELRNDLAERFQYFLEDLRKQTLEELHRFYTEEMGLAEYSTRLGRLFTLCLTFREGNALFREFFRMQVTIFDLFIAETVLKELFL